MKKIIKYLLGGLFFCLAFSIALPLMSCKVSKSEKTDETTITTTTKTVDTTTTKTVDTTTTIESYDFNDFGITFNDKTYVYDSSIQTIKISGNLPSDITVTYSGKGCNVGEYTITAFFNDNSGKYINVPESLTAKLTITKATFNPSKLVFSETSFEYDGTEKQLSILSGLPSNNQVKATITDGAKTLPGNYTAVVSFEVSGNYNEVEPITIDWEITKATIITFDCAGVGTLENQNVKYGKTFTLPTLTKEGYTFNGWKYNGVLIDETQPWSIDETNVTVVADFTANEYLLSYKVNNQILDQVVVTYDEEFTVATKFDVLNSNYYCLYWIAPDKEEYDGGGTYTWKTTSSVTWQAYLTYTGDEFTVSDGIITGYTGTETDIYIPQYIVASMGESNYEITGIGSSAFKDNTNIKMVDYYTNITSVGNKAFANCTGLTKLYIDGDATYPNASNSAFEGCSGLTSLGYLDTSITINYLFTIPDYIFANIKSLTKVTLCDSITKIGEYSFYGCTQLEEIETPLYLEEIGRSAFHGCTALKQFIANDNLKTIGDSSFYGCISLTKVVLNSGLTDLGNNTFKNCENLESVYIPNSVVVFGNSANGSFSGCTKLLTVGYPSNNANITIEYVTEIPQYIFAETSITTVTLIDTIETIGKYAFYNCESLKTINMPVNLKTIEQLVFYQCVSLTNLTFHNSLETIASSAFYECKAMTKLTLPDSLKSIGNNAFKNSTGLTSVYISSAIEEIGNSANGAFEGCSGLTSAGYYGSGAAIIFGGNNIIDCMFAGSLITKVYINTNTTSIGKYAFYKCDSLTTVYYTGSQTQWESITIGSNNTLLTAITPNYNYQG